MSGFLRRLRATSFGSLTVGAVVLVAACSSSGTIRSGGASDGGGSGGSSASVSGGLLGGVSSAQPSAQADKPDGFADPAVCATVTSTLASDEKSYEDAVDTQQAGPMDSALHRMSDDVTPLGPRAAGPLGLLVNSLIIEAANDRTAFDAKIVPSPWHHILAAMKAVCAAHAGNTHFVEVCDRIEQHFSTAATALAAARDDQSGRSTAIRNLGDQAIADAAPLDKQQTNDAGRLKVEASMVKELMVSHFAGPPDPYADNGVERTGVPIAADCAGTNLPFK